MPLHRHLVRRRVLIAIVVAGALTATDWPVSVLNGFWRDHPLVSGVATGVLLLYFAVVVVEEWIEQRETERWVPIAGLAYRALANEARDVRVRLTHYVEGPSATWWQPDQWADEAERVIATHRAELRSLADGGSRLRLLAEDPEWRSVAWQGVRYAKRLGWDVVAKWTPVVAVNARFAGPLQELTRLNDQVAVLQVALDDSQGFSPVSDIVEQWSKVIAETHRVERRLIRQAAELDAASVALAVHAAHRDGNSGAT